MVTIIRFASNRPCSHKTVTLHSLIHKLINIKIKKDNFVKKRNLINIRAITIKKIMGKIIKIKLKKQSENKIINKFDKIG